MTIISEVLEEQCGKQNTALPQPRQSTDAQPKAVAAAVIANAGMETDNPKAVAVSPSATTPAQTEAALTRREFLSYAWGAALGALSLEMGLASYFFMAPRFRAGEFGGKFFLADTSVPAPAVAPVGYMAGKFWLVNTEEGPKALYMVCTHLGCLYKWEASKQRFECPCHGSKFNYDGYYIAGPAPRSLDTFAISIENGQMVVDTGKKSLGDPSSKSPALRDDVIPSTERWDTSEARQSAG